MIRLGRAVAVICLVIFLLDCARALHNAKQLLNDAQNHVTLHLCDSVSRTRNNLFDVCPKAQEVCNAGWIAGFGTALGDLWRQRMIWGLGDVGHFMLQYGLIRSMVVLENVVDAVVRILYVGVIAVIAWVIFVRAWPFYTRRRTKKRVQEDIQTAAVAAVPRSALAG